MVIAINYVLMDCFDDIIYSTSRLQIPVRTVLSTGIIFRVSTGFFT